MYVYRLYIIHELIALWAHIPLPTRTHFVCTFLLVENFMWACDRPNNSSRHHFPPAKVHAPERDRRAEVVEKIGSKRKCTAITLYFILSIIFTLSVTKNDINKHNRFNNASNKWKKSSQPAVRRDDKISHNFLCNKKAEKWNEITVNKYNNNLNRHVAPQCESDFFYLVRANFRLRWAISYFCMFMHCALTVYR